METNKKNKVTLNYSFLLSPSMSDPPVDYTGGISV